ncbi:MAG: NADH-quinone oxidoreductase subunit D [Bifidobacteriaceae bacterium]|jgi:NADH-quinone oxidoreductase subunit D|nr:NADH-quinone oxidoreductase subunit D [Bifidobacteriaceae bacterium]
MTSAIHAAPPDDLAAAEEFVATGGDWDEIAEELARRKEERIVVNMGPQHPSTHGVLRLILEMDGETVVETRVGLGFLHTGIEKTMEYRTWAQGSALATRMDYVASIMNEAGYCLAVEKLAGITDRIPERAQVIRVLMMELARVSSHLVCLGSAGNELGGTTLMTIAFREREQVLRFFEMVTGQRMNNAYLRPGGVAQDLPPGALDWLKGVYMSMVRGMDDFDNMVMMNPIWRSRTVGIGVLNLAACMALGITGPMVRATGLPLDLRKDKPYSGYENYDFEVCTADTSDVYGRYLVRSNEMRESMKIIAQCVDKLEAMGPGPVMIEDPAIAWPAKLEIGPDGQGQSAAHVKEIMSQSMESLIHHFKLVTEGFRVPAGQAFHAIEHAKGVYGVHVVSDGGTRPYRVHVREPSYNNLQSMAMLCNGGTISDVVVCLASIDPVMGGVDR